MPASDLGPSPTPLLQRAASWASFFWRRQVFGIRIPARPGFEPAGWDLYVECLARAGSVGDFGSGASTLVAAQRGLPFVTVESDRAFLDAVRLEVQTQGLLDAARQTYLHADIGWTEAWGKPVFRRRTEARLARWRTYPQAPWAVLATLPGPHLILIDGRFRVACALMAARFLAGRAGEILIDDQGNRDEYRVVERHLELRQRAGRMTLFTARPGPEAPGLDADADLELSWADWR